MKAASRWLERFGLWLVVLILLAGGLPLRAPVARAAANRVAYVYGSNATLRNQFVGMLNGKGLQVDAYQETDPSLTAALLASVDAIVIADDAAAAGALDSNAFAAIQGSGKPVVAVGLGGALFFNQAGLSGVTSGGLNTAQTNAYIHAVDPLAPVWSAPDVIPIPDQNKALYLSAVGAYAYQAINTVPFVTRIGRLPGTPNLYSLISQFQNSRCYTYFGYREVPALQAATSLFLNLLEGKPCSQGSYTLSAALANTSPVIDGAYNYGEWPLKPLPNTNFLRLDHGFLLASNDSIRLYLLIDLLEANIVNPLPNPADLMVSFDVDNDGAITPGVDKNFTTEAGTYNLRYQTYNGPANWTLLSSSSKSSLGPAFDCSTEDGTKVLQLGPPAALTCAKHQIFEVAIDLSEINALPNQVVHLGIRARSPNPNFVDEVPNAFVVDFSNLISLKLNAGNIVSTPGTSIQFTTPAFEITQVVQTASNSIPLVAEKTAAGRISVKEIGSPNPQPYVAYLFGQRGPHDLPGSPLVKIVSAPPTVDRGNLNHTANFLLPTSWTTLGEATFHAEARDFNGNNITSGYQLLTFQHKQTPVYWIIQQNMAAQNAPPSLMAQNDLDNFMSYTRAVFPVPDIQFSVRSWFTFGALNDLALDKNVKLIDKYYSQVSASYWNAILNNLPPPYAMPDQIFGARNGGGGLSDPTWDSSSNGRATAGGNSATSLEGVVAHELNHNLDRSANGTWGRHVGACGASGADPNWPYGSSFTVQEYGFDTRQPWMTTSVIPLSMPDLMSYCRSGTLPTKWISPYRYNAWFGSASFPNNTPAPQLIAGPTPSPSIYVSGSISANGTVGALNPAFFAAGIPITPSAAGGYALVLSGPPGTPSVTHNFDILFTDVEGNPRSEVGFNFVLPDAGTFTRIDLLKAGQASPLTSITRSNTPPSGAFTNPVGPLTLNGSTTVSWSLTPDNVPLAGLSLALYYSADNGITWMPVSLPLRGTQTSYVLDASILPKSTTGKLRLWVSDGLRDVYIDTIAPLTVGNHPPQPHIAAPLNGKFIPSGTTLRFAGWADDIDTANLPPDNFLWTLDGTSTVIGIGSAIQATLLDGVHTVTLTVVDPDGANASTSITLYVQTYRMFLSVVRK